MEDLGLAPEAVREQLRRSLRYILLPTSWQLACHLHSQIVVSALPVYDAPGSFCSYVDLGSDVHRLCSPLMFLQMVQVP